jgi:hypothetical protein
VFVALALPAAFVVSTFVLARLGLGSTLLRLLAVIAVVPALLAIDRARVLERRGLHCRGCGYDLRGQVAPRCPECSRELDEAEQAAVQRGTVAASADREPRRAWPWLVVAVVLLIGTIVLVGYTHWRGGPRGSAATNPVPATAPAVPSGC